MSTFDTFLRNNSQEHLPPKRNIDPTVNTLYHSTSESGAKAILSGLGIVPRSHTGIDSRYKDFPSNPDYVYLSYSHGAYFAGSVAGDQQSITGELAKASILEIDGNKLDKSLFYPDEDFLEQHGRRNNDGITGNIYTRTAYYRENMSNYAELWESCFKLSGSIAYFGMIPLHAIKRICHIDWKLIENKTLLKIYETYFRRKAPSYINYPHYGASQRELTELFFGDRTLVNGDRFRINSSALSVVKNKKYKK